MVKRIKRIFCGIMIFSFTMAMAPQVNAFATTEKKDNSIKVITDINELYKKAKKEKGNEDQNKKLNGKWKITDNVSKTSKDIDTISTTQLVSEDANSATYMTTMFTDTVKEGETFLIAANSLSTPSSGSKWDETLSVRAYTSITFTVSTINNKQCINIDYTSGGWEIVQTGVYLEGRHYRVGQNGSDPYNLYVNNQIIDANTQYNTWSCTPNFSKKIQMIPLRAVGVTTDATIKRGTSSTWSLSFTYNL